MRISDWSSDVCSSDLLRARVGSRGCRDLHRERTEPCRQRPLQGRLDDAPLRPPRKRRPRDPDGVGDARLYDRAGDARRGQLAAPPRQRARDPAGVAAGDRRRARLCERMTMTRLANSRVIQAPTGTELNAKSWLTDTPLRMMANNQIGRAHV